MIGIDSLRLDRTKMGGYKYNTCPALYEMALNGVNCINAVTNSGPTQFAYPSIVSSSNPLDYGGYDDGVIDRPDIISEVFSQLGYETFSFGADCWISEPNGYKRGFNSFENIFDIDTIWKNAEIYLSHYRRLLNHKLVSKKEYIDLNFNFLEKHIRQTIDYCCEELANESLNKEKYRDLYPYNFSFVKKVFEQELNSLMKDKEFYINSLKKINDINSFFDIGDFIRIYNKSYFGILFFLINKHEFIRNVFYKIRNRLYKNFTTSNYMTSKFLKWLNESKTQPFFASIFYGDTHDLVCSEGMKNSYRSGLNNLMSEIDRPERFTFTERVMPSSPEMNDALYDASIKFIDNNIAKIISYLKLNNLLDSTLIVLYSDHGTDLNFKNSSRDLTASFYDEYIRVPMVYYSPQIESKEITSNVTLSDIGPTLLDLIGERKRMLWNGLPVYSENVSDREYVMLENMGKGPCDILRKPINIAIRNKNWKLIFCESSAGICETLHLVELYDLNNDPKELNNLAKVLDYNNMVNELMNVSIKRCKEIRVAYNKLHFSFKA